MERENFPYHHSSSKFIAGIFVLIAGGLFFYSENNFQDRRASPDANTKVGSVKESDKLVTHYMQETNRKMEAKKKLEDLSMSFRVPHVGQMLPMKPEAEKPLELDTPGDEPTQRRGYLPPDISTDDSSPRATVEHQLNDQQRVAIYDREYRQKYIQAFVENARRNGWNIRVDKNGVVTESTPISGFDENSQNHPTNIFIPSAPGE